MRPSTRSWRPFLTNAVTIAARDLKIPPFAIDFLEPVCYKLVCALCVRAAERPFA